MPLAFNNATVWKRLLSISSEKFSQKKGMRPHWRLSRRLRVFEVVKAKIGQSGRQLDKKGGHLGNHPVKIKI